MKRMIRKIALFLMALAWIGIADAEVSAAVIPEGEVPVLSFSATTGTVSQTIYFSGTDEAYYSYVPESTGYYEFDTEGMNLTIYDSLGNDVSSNGWYSRLEQGQMYYFYLTSWGEWYSGGTITMEPVVESAYESLVCLAKGATWQPQLENGIWVASAIWSSSDTAVATVDENGTVTACGIGSAMISVSGTTLTGQSFSDTISIQVSEPVLNCTSISLNLYNGYMISYGDKEGYYQCDANVLAVLGTTASSDVSIRAIDAAGNTTTNVYVEGYWSYYDNAYQIFVYPKKTGNYTVEVNADGKILTCSLNVFRMYFKRNSKTVADGKSSTWSESSSMLALYPGESATLSAKGASGAIKWKSSDKSVAKVDSSGKVTGKAAGYAVISATSGGCTITYMVGVGEKTAVVALRKCYSMYGNTKYSQPKRMQKGYADCSSFVWKGYKAAGKTLGSSSYALTAAGLSDWCKNQGYRIFYGQADVNVLLPGDLIFWCGETNGRSDGIYHVDIYQGNYTALTVEREKYLGDTLVNVIIARPCIKTAAASVKAAGGRKLTVSWKKVFGATGYEIYRSTSAGGTYKKVATIKGDAVTSWTSGKLTTGKTYYYKVRPYWKAGGKTCRAKFSSAVHAKVKK